MKAGYIGEGDYLKIKLQLLQFQTDVSSARLARVQALVGLRELLGYNAVPADYDVIGDLAYQAAKANLEDLQMKAVDLRPDLRAAKFGITAAQSQIGLGPRQNAKVDVNGTFDYTHVSGENTASMFVNFALPVFNRNQGEIAGIRTAIRQASLLRLRPIMMTALVACLGLLPATPSTGIGSDTQRPFAIVIVAGLISRLFIGFFVNPVLYEMVAREGDVLKV